LEFSPPSVHGLLILHGGTGFRLSYFAAGAVMVTRRCGMLRCGARAAPKGEEMQKTNSGRSFEDFRLGEEIVHATPRTVTTGDVALYNSLFGSRFAVQSSNEFARRVGYPRSPIDDLLVFHIVFGKTVPDISLNAVANLGYADCRFLKPVYPGATLKAVSQVIGLKENSNRKTGIVYVRSRGFDEVGDCVLDYVRWVMVRKRDEAAPAPQEHVPELPKAVAPAALGTACPRIDPRAYDTALSGSSHRFGDYRDGEKIDHMDGMTVEEAEHQIATRLYQNTARVHFNQFSEGQGRFGRRLVYGGHVISLARALSFNGLANAFHIAAINGGRHVAPLFAGCTVFAWSEVLETAEWPGRTDIGALRLRTIATKDRPCSDFPLKRGADYDPEVILDLDYWVAMVR
jgi:2-methylfumaryl-CoA hydratase